MAPVARGNELIEFEWRSRITGELKTNVMHKIRLPAVVADALRSFPLDIRIVDEDGLTWPVMIWTRTPGDSPDEPDRWQPVMMDRPDDEAQREGIAEVYFNTGARARSLSYVDVSVDDYAGALQARVLGRGNPTGAWELITQGMVNAYDDARPQRLEMNQAATYRLIKVEVDHAGDEPAVDVEAVGAVPYYLMFTPLSGRKAHLYFGSTRYQLPPASFVQGIDVDAVAAAHEVTLARRHLNPARVVNSLDNYWKAILYLLLAIVVSTVSVLSLRLIRMRYF